MDLGGVWEGVNMVKKKKIRVDSKELINMRRKNKINVSFSLKKKVFKHIKKNAGF